MKTFFKSVLLVALLAGLAFTLKFRVDAAAREPDGPIESAPPSVTLAPTATPKPTATPEPTPEPTPESFTLSVIGDMTLTSHQNLADTSPYSYAGRMQGDYSYPFSNTIQYFENDDFTIGNLECTFSDRKLQASMYAQFYFKAPTEYANILLNGSVEFVTTANNHAMDFGQNGLDDTFAALEEYGIPYGKEGETSIFTTESGLKIGIYCDYNEYQPNQQKCIDAINQLKADGAEYIICAFHWGKELKYRPIEFQTELGRACIDAGANLIYGSHSHCLQPLEEYNGGIILYSMGNWSFGGSSSPTDPDTAIVQISVKRDVDGSISNEGFTVIPCGVSSLPFGSNSGTYNDYKPTPYEEGTEEYARAMSKIMGAYEGADGVADYSSWYQSWG